MSYEEQLTENITRGVSSIRKIRRSASATVLTGVSLFGVGLVLRIYARSLAWPAKWSYPGERINTEWANHEAVYTDISYFIVALGIALIAVGVRNSNDTQQK
jgi:hypothetical protein